ncbi:MAG TPA: hypothetical protein VGQ29_12095 [Gemmatimonadales bacterium]|nr:hypothetical protein [Gemmatimonadales bacterium]
MTAQQLVAAVTAGYYRETGNGTRETLRPVIEVIERAHPGVIELKGTDERPGFDVKLSERPFPKRYEGELRKAVESVVGAFPVSRVPFPASRVPFPEESARKPGLLHRMVVAVRKLFSA